MPDRDQIAARHGIPHLAHKLVGETAEALEADAAAKAAIIGLVGGELNYPQADEQIGEPDRTIDERIEQMVLKDEENGLRRKQQIEADAYRDMSVLEAVKYAEASKRATHNRLIKLAHKMEKSDE